MDRALYDPSVRPQRVGVRMLLGSLRDPSGIIFGVILEPFGDQGASGSQGIRKAQNIWSLSVKVAWMSVAPRRNAQHGAQFMCFTIENDERA